MKVIIQIPCLDEAPHIGAVIAALPRTLAGVDEVEVLVIDDGSTDGTSAAARSAGADHIVCFPRTRGLSIAFQEGLRHALRAGADIIVNTDGDGQYDATSIPDLIAPILAGEADIVVGDRRPHQNPEFSWGKRLLQRVGSCVVELAGVPGATDAASGFRAYTREAALDLIVISRYTYTIESTIQAGLGPLHITWVPVRTHSKTRESRLVRSVSDYVRRNAFTILRVFAMYRPLRFFGTIGAVLAFAAFAAFTPFLVSWLLDGSTEGHLQSINLGVILSVCAVLMFAIGWLGDVLSGVREISHSALVEIRRMQLDTPWPVRSGGARPAP